MKARHSISEVKLTDEQRRKLERLWFIYGNHGSKTTPGNHCFIQGFLEHGQDLRHLRGWKPTAECMSAVDAVMVDE